jgi:DNA protecting protein DprA
MMIEVDVEEQAYWLLLAYRCGLTTRIVNEIITSWCQQQGRTLREFFKASSDEWREVCNLREKTIKKLEKICCPQQEAPISDQKIDALSEQATILKQLEYESIYTLNRLDIKYPALLNKTLTVEQVPPLLFYAGDPGILEQVTIALIGSRSASDSSIAFAREAARCLAEQGANVISGYARGVDRAAYEGATTTQGCTTVILPHGINKTNNAQLYSLLPGIAAGKALLLSQFHPNAAWMVSRAMERNRLVAGLAHIVIVCEAKLQGGTWTGALSALEQGRPVYVCQTDAEIQSEGNRELIKRGAQSLYWPDGGASGADRDPSMPLQQTSSELRRHQYYIMSQQIASLLHSNSPISVPSRGMYKE